MNQELKKHILTYLENNIRYDKRKPDEFRELSFQTGIFKTAEGSSRVKIGGTEVLCGIKLEVSEPYPDSPDKGSIMVNTELLPLSSPEYESGPPGIKSIEIARVIDRGIRESDALDFKKLCIKKGELMWMVIIDVVPLNDEGNILDAGGIAALLALEDTVFPKLEGGKINYKEKTNKKLPLTKRPVPVTVLKIGNHFLVDPLVNEEEVLDARLTVTMMQDGKICSLQKGGNAPLSTDDIEKMIDLAGKKVEDIRKQLEMQ